jgi:hypothetical protein
MRIGKYYGQAYGRSGGKPPHGKAYRKALKLEKFDSRSNHPAMSGLTIMQWMAGDNMTRTGRPNRKPTSTFLSYKQKTPIHIS